MMLSEEQCARFDALYRDHVDHVFHFCTRMGLGDRGWAEDRTQEVFVKLAENISRLHSLDSIGGWLRRVATNTCLMHFRRRSRWKNIRSSLTANDREEETPHSSVQGQRAAADLRTSLEALPVKLRIVIMLIYFSDYSQSEAAEILEISKGELSKRHKKALDRLRRMNWKMADDPGF